MASQEELDRLKEIRELERELAGIRSDTLNDVRDMSNFLSDSASALKLEAAQHNQIRSLARQINKVAQESYTISLSEIGTSQNLAKIQKDRESLQKKITALSQIQKTFSESENRDQQEIAENISFQVQETQKLLTELKEVEEESSRIKNNLGVKGFAVTEDIVGAIPGLRQFKGTFSDAADSARQVAASGGSASKAFAAGAKSIGRAAAAALPLLIITELIKAFIQIDKSSGEIAKNLGISYNEATALNREFNSIAVNSDNIFVTTQNLSEAFLSINDSLGTNSSLSSDLLVTQTELVKQAGYSVETATQLSKLSLATGKSSKNITTEFLGQLTLLNLQNKSSEVITGRQLNLERARFFALTNDLASLGKELEKQDITRQSFAESTRIEQDAIAKSLNMSRDEMAAMLLEQEALTNLSGIEGASAQERFNNLVKEVGLEEARRRIGDETLANQLASVSTQEKFAQTLSKLQEIFISLVDPLLPVLQVFGDIFSLVGGIVKLLDPVIKTVGVVVSAFNIFDGGKSFDAALSAQAKSIEDNWKLSSKEMFTTVNDGIAPSSKGPFTITDSFGATSITAKGDGLAVSPNIQREGRNTPTNVTVTLSQSDIKAIASAVREGASQATINLDGDRVSSRLQTPMITNTLPGV
jgi:hypothetical protein